jgi:hypothetical protein
MSTELAAWAPPLRTLRHGTGRTRADDHRIAVQREPDARRGGPGDSHGNGEYRVGTEAGLVGGAVEVRHGEVDLLLTGHVSTHERADDGLVDMAYRLGDPLAAIGVASVP